MVCIETCFPQASDELLIATAYFSVRGYDATRAHISNAVRINVLVGKRDGHILQQAVIVEVNDCRTPIRR